MIDLRKILLAWIIIGMEGNLVQMAIPLLKQIIKKGNFILLVVKISTIKQLT